MLDLKRIRAEPDAVRAALERRGDGAALDDVIALDAERRTLQASVDELRAEANTAAAEIQRRKKAGEDADEQIAANRTIRQRVTSLEGELREADAALRERLLDLPNLPHDSVPAG